MATRCSKKGSQKVLRRVLGKGSEKGSLKGACYGKGRPNHDHDHFSELFAIALTAVIVL